MKPLPEDKIEKRKVSVTEKIARVLVLAWFAALLGYFVVQCDAYYQPYNDRHAAEERKPNP